MADVSAPSAPPCDLVELGRIVSAYGIRGWVKIQPHSPQAEVLRSTAQWWIASPVPPLQASGASRSTKMVRYDVLQVRPQGSTLVAELSGLSDRDDAEALRGHLVSVSRADFPAASSDEYYWVDLIGCRVFGVSAADASADPVLLGIVHEVVENGAHAILQVHRQHLLSDGTTQNVLDSKGRAVELLIPFVAAHVSDVDLKARRIETDWPDAL